MAKVKLESIYNEKTKKKDIDTPIKTAFDKIKYYTSPLLKFELTRKRQKEK